MTGSQGTQKQSGTSTTTSTASPQMSDFVNFLQSNIIQPLTKNFMPQMLEALKTGGAPGAQIPLVQNTVSALRKGFSSATSGIKNMLAQTGLLNTPFGQRILSQTATSGEEAVSQVSPNVAASLIGGAPGMISGTSNSVINALSGTGTKTTTSTGTGGTSAIDAGGTASGAGGLLASLLPMFGGGAGAGAGIAGFGAGGAAGAFAPALAGTLSSNSMLELAPLLSLALL